MTQTEFPCAKCGAKLTFEPGTQTLKCAHCGFENTVPQVWGSVEELDYQAYLQKLAGESVQHETETIKCSSCGAETTLPVDTVAGKCAFCGSAVVAESQSRRLIKPRSLLPFSITRQQAAESFRSWIGSLWLAPSGLKRRAETDGHLSGVYVPYWTYDAATLSLYTGQRGDDYTVIVNNRTETRTRWADVSGQVGHRFDDVLVLASQTLPQKYTDRLEPWDLQDLVAYSDDYLSGFVAESYQVGLPEGFAAAQAKMDEAIRGLIRQDIGGDHQRIQEVRTRYDGVTFKHLLLPIWLSAYRYQAKAYRFLVNARTGEVQGERPYSVWKISALAAVGLAIATAIVWAYLHQ